MAKRSQKAIAAVERVLKRKKDAKPAELRAAAEKADASVKKLQPRSFNAQYVLPSKRKLGLTHKRTSKKKTVKKKKTTRRRVTRGLTGRDRARQLVRERDLQVKRILLSGKDQEAAYQLGAGIDDFIGQIENALKS